MPFSPQTKNEIESYITNHLPDEDWFENYFDYIQDPVLSARLAEEFKAIRYIYKFFEGIQADDWLLNAQIRIQIIYYASIYEAVIHHILFSLLPTRPEVLALFETKMYKKISVRKDLDNLMHDGKKIWTMYEDIGHRDVRQIRFEYKADAAVLLGLISPTLCEELKEIYALRNAIHLHAEIARGVNYEMEMSLKAYRRMKIFREQLTGGMLRMGLLPPPAVHNLTPGI